MNAHSKKEKHLVLMYRFVHANVALRFYMHFIKVHFDVHVCIYIPTFQVACPELIVSYSRSVSEEHT